LNVTPRAATMATLVLAIVLCSSPRDAQADYLFTPFIGGAFARQTTFLTGIEQGESATRVIFGGSAGWLSDGILGFEGDFAYAPRFFERDNPEDIVIRSSAMTLSGSVIAAVPLSVSNYSLRPYAVGGVGLMRSGLEYLVLPRVDDNSMAINVGAGAIGFFTPRTGVRFELRHFRTVNREPNPATLESAAKLSFWRFTVGVVIRN
jgi:hypothetical protein